MKASLQDLKTELWLRKRNAGEIKWETKNGELIPIKDMTDQHLVNTIKMLEKYYERLNQKLEEEMEELEHIGDMDPMDYYD